MPTLLRIDSSTDPARSRSRAITQAFADAWRALGAEHTVVERDLHAAPVPHLAHASMHWPPRLRPAGDVVPPEADALQQELLDELLGADVLLLGAPLYNYSLPSSLKAWIDHIHVPGVTADFDVEAHPLAGRPAVIASPRGASYDAGSPTDGWDHAVPALRIVLGEALGMHVEVLAPSLTLAGTVPALAEFRERASAEFEQALADAAALAARLG